MARLGLKGIKKRNDGIQSWKCLTRMLKNENWANYHRLPGTGHNHKLRENDRIEASDSIAQYWNLWIYLICYYKDINKYKLL